MIRSLLTALVVGSLAAPLSAGNWPAWRGPSGDGISQETGMPTEWSSTENITWKVDLPEPGNSTPIVWNDRVFITSQLEGGKVRAVMCFNRDDGKLLWQQGIRHEEAEPSHKTNPYCSASPVTDGELVVAWHGSAGLVAYDFEGKELWHRDYGKFIHIWGNAASPILHGDHVIAHLGPGLRSMIVALDKRTGKEVWKRELPEAQSKSKEQFFGSWSTPVLRTLGGRQEMLLSLPQNLRAFDPSSGEDIWTCAGLSDLVYTSPLTKGDIVVAMSGYTGPAIAVEAKAGAEGDITSSRLWQHKKNPQRVGSGVIVGDHIFMVNEPGTAECIELRTGDSVWKQRLTGSTWASLVHADDKLWITDRDGTSFVFKPAKEFELVAKNPLAEKEITQASLAMSDGQIFLRSYQRLYCIGKRKQ